MKFLDEAKVYIRSGRGGAGCVSFRREKYVEFGGPDGGNGGRGGHVYVECVEGLNTLIDYRYQQHFKAATGGHGMGKSRTGRDAQDMVLKVPSGTQIFAEDKDSLLAELMEPGERVLLLEGGHGGLGNEHFKSSTNRAPRRSTPGGDEKEQWIWLKLKLIADAGLVGLPNAGKSTFLSVVSRARPKIADYPFTTLKPQLGVVSSRDREFVLADIPGLIEGASEGVGLGHRFLSHLERCRVLLHLIDGTGDDVVGAYKTVRDEVLAYGDGILSDKPEVVALNKVDALDEDVVREKLAALKDVCGQHPLAISGVAKRNIDEVVMTLARVIDDAKRDEAEEEAIEMAQETPWSPV